MTAETYNYMEYDNKFQDLIAKRKEKGISQRKMSELLGVTEASVSRWESFQRRSLIAYFGYKKILGGE
jgi:transcriptional regulator with XRE-family HTH domain